MTTMPSQNRITLEGKDYATNKRKENINIYTKKELYITNKREKEEINERRKIIRKIIRKIK